MIRVFMAALVGLFMVSVNPVMAASYGTPDEAKAMAEKAAATVKSEGRDKAFAEFNKAGGSFSDRDLYVFAIDYTGKVLSHGANAKLIGKNLSKIKDVNGKAFINDMIAASKGESAGWVDYHWAHPETKKIAPKTSYVIGIADYFVGVGAYK